MRERKKKKWYGMCETNKSKRQKKQKNKIDYDMEFFKSLFILNIRPIRSKNSRNIYRNSGFKSNTTISAISE